MTVILRNFESVVTKETEKNRTVTEIFIFVKLSILYMHYYCYYNMLYKDTPQFFCVDNS